MTRSLILRTSGSRPDSRLVAVMQPANGVDGDAVLTLYSPSGQQIASAPAQRRDLLDLAITLRDNVQLGSLTIVAGVGWDGYWIQTADGQNLHVSGKDFRSAIDHLEALILGQGGRWAA
jgi:hypothetical protein